MKIKYMDPREMLAMLIGKVASFAKGVQEKGLYTKSISPT